MSRFNLTLLIGSVLIGFAFDVTAQDKTVKPDLLNLAIEIAESGHQFPVPGPGSDGGYAEIGPPPKRPDWKQASDRAPLTRIRIRSMTETDGVRIKVAAVFDDSQPVDAPGPKYGAKEQLIASYLAQLDQTITVRELEDFGFEGLVLKVVKYKPRPVNDRPLTVFPEVVNELRSVSFIDLQKEDPANNIYRLTLKNLTSKTIVALSVRLPPIEIQTMMANKLAAPGAMLQTSIRVRGDDSAESLPPTLVIRMVLFDDGSYEGDVVLAAEIAARNRTQRLQLARLLQLLRETKEQLNREDDTAIQELKAGVESFRIDVEPTLITELQTQFPTLPPGRDKVWLTSAAMDGMKGGRQRALSLLREFEQTRTGNPESFSFDQSLLALIERVAKLAGAP